MVMVAIIRILEVVDVINCSVSTDYGFGLVVRIMVIVVRMAKTHQTTDNKCWR